VDVAVMRFQKYIADNGKTADVYVIRDGQKLTYEETLAEMNGVGDCKMQSQDSKRK
jgi:hypothetical protein